jgi:hypothetical protein
MKTKTGNTIAPNESQRQWSSGTPKLMAPVNGPGVNFSKTMDSFGSTDSERITNSSQKDPYLCPELGPVPGLTPDRMDAYRLPSRMGKSLHYPDGRVEVLS